MREVVLHGMQAVPEMHQASLRAAPVRGFTELFFDVLDRPPQVGGQPSGIHREQLVHGLLGHIFGRSRRGPGARNRPVGSVLEQLRVHLAGRIIDVLARRVHAEVGPVQLSSELVDGDEIHHLEKEALAHNVGGHTDHELGQVSLPVPEVHRIGLLVGELARRTVTPLPRFGQCDPLDLFMDLRFGPLDRDPPASRSGFDGGGRQTRRSLRVTLGRRRLGQLAGMLIKETRDRGVPGGPLQRHDQARIDASQLGGHRRQRGRGRHLFHDGCRGRGGSIHRLGLGAFFSRTCRNPFH